MKRMWKELALAIALAWGMPWLFLGVAEITVLRPNQQETMPHLTTTAPTQAPEAAQTVRVLTEAGETDMELTRYLAGVLLGELPGSFHMEAKKAQAVVARTYTLRAVTAADKHGGAICTDSSCCQNYCDLTAYLAAGGSADTATQAMQAVEETDGLVLTYDGALIDATYFSCSGGYTEDAVAVWGSDVPYLQAVASPGEEIAEHYTDTVTYTASGFQDALGVSLAGSPSGWLGAVSYTSGGGVDTMVIGGTAYKGTQLRSLLELRSTVFTMTAVGDSIVITTKGYGHRVGMSQYGAQAMALSGSSYEQILLHYYQGTQLVPMER